MNLTYTDSPKRAELFKLALLLAGMVLLLARPACAGENQATIAAFDAALTAHLDSTAQQRRAALSRARIPIGDQPPATGPARQRSQAMVYAVR